MAVRRRGKRWVADYYDAFRIRRWKTFGTKDEAVTFAAQEKVRATEDGGLAPVVDPDVSMTVYAEKWLKDCEARGVKPKTITRCKSALRLHVLPRLGGLGVRKISRPAVRQLLLAKLAEHDGSRQGLRPSRQDAKRTQSKLARGTVKHLFMVLSGLLSSAVEDGIIKANPIRGLWKALGKAGKAQGSKKSAVEVPAFDADQAGRFLAAAEQHAPEHYPALATMMLAGLRVGEALAVTPEKIDLAKRTLRVDAQVGGTLKDDEPRMVDLAAPLVSILAALVEARSKASTRVKMVTIAGSSQAQPAAPAGPWLFYPELGPAPTGKDEQRVYKNLARAFARLLRLAGLPAHHTPKSLRHTFGSGLISRGVSPAYVQEQMGHSSIEITVDVYGSSLPMKAPGAVDALAAAVLPGSDGSRMVAEGIREAV